MSAAMLDGFNLLPYRARKRREVRRQRLALLGAMSLAGCAAVGAVAGWDTFERARLDERRMALEASLRTSGAQIDEHARLVRAESDRRRVREIVRAHDSVEIVTAEAAPGRDFAVTARCKMLGAP